MTIGKMTIGKIIMTRRKFLHITRKEFASEMCVSEEAVRKWEADLTRPEIWKIKDICEYLGLSFEELLGFTPGWKPKPIVVATNMDTGEKRGFRNWNAAREWMKENKNQYVYSEGYQNTFRYAAKK